MAQLTSAATRPSSGQRYTPSELSRAFVTSYVARVCASSENCKSSPKTFDLGPHRFGIFVLAKGRNVSRQPSSPAFCTTHNSKRDCGKVYISASFINSVTSAVSTAFPKEEVQYLWTEVAARATAEG
ncbi:hypothetical protein Fot_11528 [Forsythia ovata]|uniref:Uncharacterized protein n=1 Tax=Forsythia ovata TaxID=205694 RepID=A0ABD1WMN3_9LAMI